MPFFSSKSTPTSITTIEWWYNATAFLRWEKKSVLDRTINFRGYLWLRVLDGGLMLHYVAMCWHRMSLRRCGNGTDHDLKARESLQDETGSYDPYYCYTFFAWTLAQHPFYNGYTKRKRHHAPRRRFQLCGLVRLWSGTPVGSLLVVADRSLYSYGQVTPMTWLILHGSKWLFTSLSPGIRSRSTSPALLLVANLPQCLFRWQRLLNSMWYWWK